MRTNMSTALQTFLDNLCTSGTGGHYAVIDLYTISLLNGIVLRLAAWDQPVPYQGYTFSAAGPYVKRSKLRQALKLEVSQIKLTLLANPTMTVNGTPVLQAIAQGMFTGATVRVDRYFAQTVNPLDTTLGAINYWFLGQVAEIDKLDRSQAILSVKDPTALLDSQHPRNLYQTSCRHTLFDYGCTLASNSYLVNGTVAAGANKTTIPSTLLTSTYPGVIAAPTSAPVLSASGPMGFVNFPNQTYYVMITWVSAAGESLPSPEGTQLVAGGGPNSAGTTNKLLQVVNPAGAPSGVTGYNVYVGAAPGDEQLQNGTPIALGTQWQMPRSGIVQGNPPPFENASGWFTLGMIKFTSGALSGVSAFIRQYADNGSGNGVFTVLPPLPAIPAAGDLFAALPGCDKAYYTCLKKYNNAAHYAGHPWIPLPEIGI